MSPILTTTIVTTIRTVIAVAFQTRKNSPAVAVRAAEKWWSHENDHPGLSRQGRVALETARRARNGRVIGASTEGYARQTACLKNLERVTGVNLYDTDGDQSLFLGHREWWLV